MIKAPLSFDQELAIQQHLAKPRSYGEACGCMGPRELRELEDISGFKDGIWPYNPNDYEPLCGCAMQEVEEVNGVFYRIIENRSPQGITFDAEMLGPRGGPYSNIKYKENADELVSDKKSAADRIAELNGTKLPKTLKDLSFKERIQHAQQLALDPKNCNWKSKSCFKDGILTKIEIINGQYVTTTGKKSN